MAERVEHQAIADQKPFEGSGKDTGLVHAPIVSMSPTSQPQQKNKPNEDQKFKVIDVHKDLFNSDTEKTYDGYYPFQSLDVGQGFFVKPKYGQTVDKLMENLNKTLWHINTEYAEIVKNENGDEIWLDVSVQMRQKNDDGTIQLEGNGKPITRANATHMPMYIYTRRFVAKAVVKDDEIGIGDKASDDGVMIIRVA